jgi:hypothetical protein
MAPGDGEERGDRVGPRVEERADLGVPGLPDPLHDGQRELLLAGEEVVERAAGVSRLRGHAFEDQVGVPVLRQAAGGRLQQGVPGAGAPFGLAPPGRLGRRRGRSHMDSHTDMHVC